MYALLVADDAGGGGGGGDVAEVDAVDGNGPVEPSKEEVGLEKRCHHVVVVVGGGDIAAAGENDDVAKSVVMEVEM